MLFHTRCVACLLVSHMYDDDSYWWSWFSSHSFKTFPSLLIYKAHMLSMNLLSIISYNIVGLGQIHPFLLRQIWGWEGWIIEATAMEIDRSSTAASLACDVYIYILFVRFAYMLINMQLHWCFCWGHVCWEWIEFKIVLQQVKDDGSCFWGCFFTPASNNDKSFAKNGYSLRKEAGVSTSWFVLMFLF